MKKILAMIMALVLVFTMVTGIAVLADEPVVAEEQAEVATEAAAPEVPADFDENSITEYLVFNFADLENVTVTSYITGTDGTLDYYLQALTSYGQQVEETEYNGAKALSIGQSTLTKDDLAGAGIGYIADEGFFADKNTFVYVSGTMLNNGYEEGKKIAEVVFDFGNKSKAHEIIVGQQNSFMEVSYKIHWINVLIALMCLVVIVLIVLIVVLAIRKKKAIKVEEAEEEFVSEDNLFDVLASEAEETTEEVVEEVAEEVVVEEAAEEKTEE